MQQMRAPCRDGRAQRLAQTQASGHCARVETGGRTFRRVAVVVAALLVSCGQDGTRVDSTEATIVVASSDAAASTTDQVPHLTTTVDSTSTSELATSPNDPANIYLEGTTEIYRRALPDGHDFVVRLSTDTYATVFGLTWKAPTGSAQCLGDHAVFVGVPGDVGYWGSAWVAGPWFDQTSPSLPVVMQESMSAAANTVPATRHLVLRTSSDAGEVVLVSRAGVEFDRSTVVNGVAMVVVGPEALSGDPVMSDLRVTVVAKDGQVSAPSPLVLAAWKAAADCGPGEAPLRPLPEPGVQPEDPATAQAQIRERYAVLVDQSTPTAQKPADLLDDNSGVQEAIAGLNAGQFADLAASATYSIDELVFTQPDEAWFRYTIATTTTTYSDRFGIATFNGKVWQITRATICQDLALALSPCQPTPETIEPPSTPEWEAAWREWISRANLYLGNDGCSPLSQC